MRYRRGSIHWYDIAFVVTAFAIIYPDTVLNWWSERFQRRWGWWHLIAYEVLLIGVTVVGVLLLMPVYPKLAWWKPLAFVAAVGLYRWLMWLVMKAFNFDD